MSVGISKPVNPEHIPEHSLWVVRKGDRTAEARARMVPLGPELRIYNGEFLRSEVVRDAQNVGDVARASESGMAGARVDRGSDGSGQQRPRTELLVGYIGGSRARIRCSGAPYHSSFTELHKDAAIVAATRSA